MGIVPMSATPLLENFAIIEMSVVLMQTVINIKRPHFQLGNSWLLSGICPTQLRERRNHPCLLVVADTLLVRRSLVTGQSGHSKISMTAHNMDGKVEWTTCVDSISSIYVYVGFNIRAISTLDLLPTRKRKIQIDRNAKVGSKGDFKVNLEKFPKHHLFLRLKVSLGLNNCA